MDLSKFMVSSEVDRIELEDSQWVDIKHEMSVQDHEKLERELYYYEHTVTPKNREERRRLGGTKKSDGQVEGPIRFSVSPAYVVLLEINIMDWSFANSDGIKLPLNKDNIGKLKRQWSDFLCEEINKRNPTPVGTQ